MPVFASPRVWINHFAELQIWLVCLSGVVLSRETGDSGRALALTMGILSLAAVVGLIGHVERVDWRRATLSAQERVVEMIRSVRGPVLSEDPMIPLMAGTAVHLPEAYMLRVAIARSPDVQSQMRRALREQRYGAIAFYKDPATADRWYDENHFGRWFIEETLRYYSPAETHGAYHIYVPRDIPAR